MQTFIQDLRYGLRQMAAQRSFTTIAVITLALGMGANIALFSTVDALFFKVLPVERPSELQQMLNTSNGNPTFSYPLWEELAKRQEVFGGIFAWSTTDFNLAQGGEVREANGVWVSGAYFSTLGVRPQLGRLVSAGDDNRAEAAPVAVLSYDFWQREYGGRADVVGHQIRLDGRLFEIIGVGPRGFQGMTVGTPFDVAVPLSTEPLVRGERSMLDMPGARWLSVVGRIKSEVTLAQANAQLAAISAATFDAAEPDSYVPPNVKRVFSAVSAENGVSGLRGQYQQALMILLGIVALILLIACANIANLLLANAVARRKEMGIRLAIGAPRGRLIQQLLTESLLLALLGTALAIPMASAGSQALLKQISRSDNPVILNLAPDLRVAGFVVATALLTTLLFGLAPAFHATRVSLNEAMTQAGPSKVEGGGRFGLTRLLVAGQVAISIVLVAGAGLLLRTFHNLTSVNAGFDASRVLLVDLDLRLQETTAKSRALLFEQALGRVRSLPGVVAASQSTMTPVSGQRWNGPIEVPGYIPKGDFDAVAFYNAVAPQYFKSLGTTLVAGRDFTVQDSMNAPRVAIVNEAFAKKFFAGRNPVGEHYSQMDGMVGRVDAEIIGLVKDAKYMRLREEPRPTTYVPMAQRDAWANTHLLVRAAATPGNLVPSVRAEIERVLPEASIKFRTLATQVGDSIIQDRIVMVLTSVFGALAVALSTVGLFGLVTRSVARRRREIGIRMALGSTPQGAVRLILSDGMRLTLFGVVLGILGALAATRVLSSFLFGVEPRDPATLAGAGILFVSVAALACTTAARKAALIQPSETIRQE